MINRRPRGRPLEYKERISNTVPLPKEARDKADELRGDVPLSKYLCRIICEKLGVS